MDRRSKIIVSIVGIFIILLALIGITYGYFLTRIEGNTNDTSISITTANLRIVYDDNSSQINATNIQPSKTEYYTKTFTVTNTGNETSSYEVYLENVINNFVNEEDLLMFITCESNIEGNTCNGYGEGSVTNGAPIFGDTIYPTVNSKLISNTIVPAEDADSEGEVHTYTLYLMFYDDDSNQSDDMGKALQGKVQIYDPKDVVTISGVVTGYEEGYYVELHSDVKTSQLKFVKEENGVNYYSYIFHGVKPENDAHKLYVMKEDNNGTSTSLLESAYEIKVTKGTNASVSRDGKEIVINDNSEIVEINLNLSKNGESYTLTTEVPVYTVTFNNESGESISTQTLTSGSKLTAPVLTKEGYVLRWLLNGEEYSINKPVTQNMTLTANFVAYGDVNVDGVVELKDISRIRLFLNGKIEFTEIQKLVADVNLDNIIDIYDIEIINLINAGLADEYNITLPIDNSRIIVVFNSEQVNESTNIINKGDKVEEPEEIPTKNGWTFDGWLLNGKTYDFNTPVTKNITLEESWKFSYVVYGDIDANGKVNAKDLTILRTSLNENRILTNVQKLLSDVNVDNIIDDYDVAILRDYILKKNTDELPHDSNAIPVVIFNNDDMDAQFINNGEVVSEPEMPAKDGWIFDGWLLNGKTYDFNTPVTKNITLEESWKFSYVVYGDVDSSGKVDAFDVTVLLQYLDNTITLSDEQKMAADVNQDNVIDEIDVYILKKYLSGEYDIDSLPYTE